MQKKIQPLLDPSQQSRMLNVFSHPIELAAMDELTQQQYKRNSLLAFTKDWNLFLIFCQDKGVQALPASVAAVRYFLETEARNRKFSTIKRYAVTINLVHHLLAQPNPTETAAIKQCLASLQAQKQGDGKQTQGLYHHHLRELFDRFHQDNSVKMIRDLAIYHLMFECALKRSELKQLSFQQLTHWQKEKATIVLTLNHQSYSLSEQAQYCLTRWINVLPLKEGIVFRSIDRHGNIGENALDDSSIFRITRNAARLLELDNLEFSGQSARVGAVKELAEQGYQVQEIQDFGRWLSPAMPYQYLGYEHSAEQEKQKFKKIKPLS